MNDNEDDLEVKPNSIELQRGKKNKVMSVSFREIKINNDTSNEINNDSIISHSFDTPHHFPLVHLSNYPQTHIVPVMNQNSFELGTFDAYAAVFDRELPISKDETNASSCKNYPIIEDSNAMISATKEFKGYKVINPKEHFFVSPNPSMMNRRGWISWTLLSIFCWPISCLPCCLSCSYDAYQVPVYGDVNNNFSTTQNNI